MRQLDIGVDAAPRIVAGVGRLAPAFDEDLAAALAADLDQAAFRHGRLGDDAGVSLFRLFQQQRTGMERSRFLVGVVDDQNFLVQLHAQLLKRF